MRALLLFACFAASAVQAAQPPTATATLAWLRDGALTVRAQPAQSNPHTHVPLGSLWKLYVYAYLAQTNAQEPVYQCGASNADSLAEQDYCCARGESVARDAALARSCGAYFEPQRLGISAQKWRTFWQPHLSAQTQWLSELSALQPEREVPLEGLLASLQAMPAQARQAAREALAQVTLSGYARAALPQLGSGPRMKTFTWHRAERPDTYFGGAAGWLADGTPFWFGATGSSKRAIEQRAAWMARALPAADADAREDACVVVDFFTRYPIAAVHDARGVRVSQAARLSGAYVLTFANGTRLPIRANGELELQHSERLAIQGRFTLEDYVARVIDREGDASIAEAARALAVLARSYLVQNAQFEAGCYRIADSSATQRVSARPPTRAAQQAAAFTAGLLIDGAPARYHRDQSAPGVLSWREAVEHAQAGVSFDALLAQRFPRATFVTRSGAQECRRLVAAEEWLTQAAARWQRTLRAEQGYEAMPDTPAVCALAHGNPYSDQRRLRIYARDWRSVNDQLTLAHEYLHLVFRFHPRGFDEAFIEATARRLIEG